nr:MAG TPA: DNA binding protein [Caudoviricetes sp.]
MSNTVNKIKKAVLREDLLAITGDFRKAIILKQFIYWSERVSDADKFIEKENAIAKNNGEEERELFYGWIYKTADELAEEIMLGLSASQVRRYVRDLVDMGFISKRNNPKYKWDRTLQYRVNLVNIAKALKEKGYPLSEYKIELPDDLSNVHECAINEAHMENQSVLDAYAIPETTTREYNSDITNTENKDFILSNKEKKTLSNNDKGSKTSAPDNINILDINNIPSRTTEQKEVYRKQKQKNRSEKYRDEDVPQILYNKFNSLYGEQENILEDHDICLTMAVITYYFKQYRSHIGEQHIMISAEYADQFMGAIIGDDSPLLKADVEEKDELRFYQDMIDEFFKSDLGQRNGKSFDRHIWLFFSERNQDILRERVKQKWEE